jgi:hypothetical protein
VQGSGDVKALTTALFAKCTVGSALHTSIGGRLYKGRGPDGATYPYAVYLLVSDVPDPTFAEQLEEVLVQFSLFSKASSSGEVEDCFTNLKALYDDCSLTISGETLLWMRRRNATLMVEDHTTPDGTVAVWHYAVEYSIMTQVP